MLLEVESLLAFATVRGKIKGLDLRTKTFPWTLTFPSHYGLITSLVVNSKANWLLTTTDTGVFTLWDIRFFIPLRSWSHPRRARINRAYLHPHGGRGKWISCSTDDVLNEVSVWDVESGGCHEVWCTLGPLGRGVDPASDLMKRYSDGLKAAPPPERSAYSSYGSGNHVDDMVPSVSKQSVRGYVADAALYTAGSDNRIRYWDPVDTSGSYVVSGMKNDDPLPQYGYVF